MAVLDIVTYPDPLLREPTTVVANITDDIRALCRDMVDTMYAQEGAGLAAPQVGRLERIFVIDGKVASGDENADALVFINPQVVETAGGEAISEEGCLSFPGVFVDIKRPRWAKVRAMNLAGDIFEASSDKLYGRALQHEADHLNGKLMMDLVGMVKKEVIKRKMKRYHADQA